MTKKFSIDKGFLVLIFLLNVILEFGIYFGHGFLVKYVDRIKNLRPSMNYFLFLIATWYLLSSWIPLMSKKELWDISVLINYNKGHIKKKKYVTFVTLGGGGWFSTDKMSHWKKEYRKWKNLDNWVIPSQLNQWWKWPSWILFKLSWFVNIH